MPPKKRRIRKKINKSRIIFLILVVVLAGIFFLYRESDKDRVPPSESKLFKTEKKVHPPVPDVAPLAPVPKVAIVMDDLGPSKKKVMTLFRMKQPFTFSVLPLQPYSRWTAEEAHRRGYDVILHIPMEASRKLKLGQGGLYLHMSNSEIIETLETNIKSMPFIKGASSHMGSAFTLDKRAMGTVAAVLKEHNLFFLDSVTSPDTVGYSMAEASEVKALRRDIFLDNEEDPEKMSHQWERLMKIAKKEGYAIALAHPRENTFQFLQETLKNNTDITVVPLSKLLDERQ
ncbi:MAG: divergent polysaccharide deacetylase family protein [Nitrospiraceae bacterium]|nr:MAG: divergent polysaccharide deacetylase family protein [Nitrospiraceae bacterium]